jgi:GAF domain-containing protein
MTTASTTCFKSGRWSFEWPYWPRLWPPPYAEREIALVQNFAAQAVIAMENARLITETREALEQQTATAEILQVINSSPGDLAPVFDAMLEKALRLCDGAYGSLLAFDGERFSAAATRGDTRYADWARRRGPFVPFSGGALERARKGEDILEITDLLTHDETRHNPAFRQMVEVGGFRSLLNVSLRKENAFFGVLAIYRKEERRFTDKQKALLQNFAAQAVIAMENARLITGTREALDQQTATAEVLGVINSSPGDLQPVFDAILEKAHALCGATYGTLLLRDGETFRALTTRGYSESLADQLRQGGQPGPSHPIWRLVDGESFTHVLDLAIVEEPWAQSVVQLAGVRTSLWVPLRRDGNLLGAITAARADVRPFSQKEIGLLQNFAAQAVIAMENARLLNEIRQRQAELRVTFDNMVDGVAMFDGELRLAAWNRNFQQIADLPEDLLAERPTYADYLRILTGVANLTS